MIKNDSKEQIIKQMYNTSLKDIGGLKDLSVLFKIIRLYFTDPNALDKSLNIHNEFDIRTERARKKVEWAIRISILQFSNQNHIDLIRNIFGANTPIQDKEISFYWHLALNDRLFRDISINVFSKAYYSGRAAISNDDIIAYLKEFIPKNADLQKNWSEETYYRIATKYLNLMSKLNFVSTGRIKSFKHIRPSSEAQILFLYIAQLFEPENGNILANKLLSLSFIPKEDFLNRLKRLSLKGYFNMNYTGSALNIELVHDYKGINDVLYN